MTGSAFAQDQATPADEKWRPKDGVYGTRACQEENGEEDEGVVIEWAKKSITAYEQICEMTALTETAPGSIRLDVACTDVMIDEPYPEVFILNKIDDKTIFVRQPKMENSNARV